MIAALILLQTAFLWGLYVHIVRRQPRWAEVAWDGVVGFVHRVAGPVFRLADGVVDVVVRRAGPALRLVRRVLPR